jgi:hypothetical protein
LQFRLLCELTLSLREADAMGFFLTNIRPI